MKRRGGKVGGNVLVSKGENVEFFGTYFATKVSREEILNCE